jgi:hypothetical protein
MSLRVRSFFSQCSAFFALLCLGVGMPFAQSSARADQAGAVIQATGDTRLSRTGFVATPVQKGTMLREGDRLRTGADGRAELRMADDATVAIGPGSDFIVERYRDQPGQGSIGLRLAHGAVRIATGLFSKNHPEGFRLQTPTATLGVRGTDFSVEQGDQTQGFAVRVFSGRVVVSSARGSVEVPTGGVLRIAALDAAPQFVDPNTGATRPAIVAPQPRPRPRAVPRSEEPTPGGAMSVPRSGAPVDPQTLGAASPRPVPEADVSADLGTGLQRRAVRPNMSNRTSGIDVMGDGSYDAQSAGQSSRFY